MYIVAAVNFIRPSSRSVVFFLFLCEPLFEQEIVVNKLSEPDSFIQIMIEQMNKEIYSVEIVGRRAYFFAAGT